jgi:hypothetical protein
VAPICTDASDALLRPPRRSVSNRGDEAAWWRTSAVDPIATARTLWLETHPVAAGRTETNRDDATAMAVLDGN